jgi:hypothetical protein
VNLRKQVYHWARLGFQALHPRRIAVQILFVLNLLELEEWFCVCVRTSLPTHKLLLTTTDDVSNCDARTCTVDDVPPDASSEILYETRDGSRGSSYNLERVPQSERFAEPIAIKLGRGRTLELLDSITLQDDDKKARPCRSGVRHHILRPFSYRLQVHPNLNRRSSARVNST